MRKVPGCGQLADEALNLLTLTTAGPEQVSVYLGLLEKALVKHLCQGDYSRLGVGTLTHFNVLMALCGP